VAKTVFRPFEVVLSGNRVDLAPPTAYPELAHLIPEEPEKEEVPEEPEIYTGPTAEDLRREAEAFRVQWEQEREALAASAQEEAQRIQEEAEAVAARKTKAAEEAVEARKQQAQAEAERLVAAAKAKAAEIESGAQAVFEEGKKAAYEEGLTAGKEAGYKEGKAEVDRLVQRTQTVLERAQDKRGDILVEMEQEVIDLVLLISRKVIKTISENQRGVVLQNVVQALRKVKARGDIIVRVNLADLKLTTEHTKDFIKMMEGASSVQVQEDSTVDPGGCVIETDFGEIDARISSQLAELEAKILEMCPMKVKSQAVTKSAQYVRENPYSGYRQST